MRNAHLTASEHGDGIVFLHRVQEGPASRSYGLQVAQLAGVPASVIRAARTRLAQLESGQMISAGAGRPAAPAQQPAQADMFSMPSALEQQLTELDPDNMSPRDALQALYQLKELLR